MRSKKSYLLFLVCAVSLAACATTKTSSAKHEPLQVPPAPPRVITPAPEPPPEEGTQPEPVPVLPRASRPAARETAPAKTEPKSTPETLPQSPPEVTATTPTTPAPAPAPGTGAPGAPELKTAGTPDDAKASKDVRDTLDRAGRLLNSIDYRALTDPSKLQYDMAKRFIEQSEDSLKTRNYIAARLMAEKAETIGKELGGH